MTDYWGATADPNYGYSPYSGQLHYGQHQMSSAPFTSKAGDGNSTTIEIIKARIHNMHPELISALADQWLNAWTVMDNVRSYVLKESNLLRDKHWDSPKARDAFLRKGPGEALAYLDVWMDAAQKNVTALRHLVTIAQDARRDIDALVAEYERKLKEAQDVDLTGQLSEWFDTSRYWTTSWGDAEKYQIQQQVQEVQETYQKKAQELAYKVGNQHYDYVSMLSSGVGPPYKPMDAVLNSPGNPPMPSLPNLPGGGPGAAPPPPAPPPASPPAPPPPANPNSLAPNGTGPVAPPVPTPAPVLPPDPAQLPNPAALPPNPALLAPLPAPPPVLPKGGPGALPSKPPASLSANAPKGAPSMPPGRQQPPNPGQLTKNSFGKGSGAGQPPGMGQPPGRTLRRPPTPGGDGEHGGRGVQRPGGGDPSRSAPPQQGRPGDRRRTDRSGFAERTPGTPVDAEEAFGRPSGNLTPPVLKNPTGDRSRIRPGSAAELPPGMRPGGDPGELLRRDGTAPPVLNRPGRPGESLPPATRGRADRRAAERDRDRKTPTGAEWIGADDARAEAGSSVLDAPTLPPSGSRVSGLEEIPQGLRSRAATRSTGPAHPARPGTVSPELSKRRTTDERHQQQVDDEARGVVTDEQAFEVQTPGGGVVTSQRDEPVYEPEVRRVLGGDR